jgi:uncharacterized glyoxalase superfamily protein PhnB
MQTLYPVLIYKDAQAAIDFLERAFGFERQTVHEDDGSVQHAELRFGSELVMLSSAASGDALFKQGIGRSSLYLVIEDPDAHHARAVEAGAELARELRDEDYGSRGYTARDPEGNLWSFGTYRPA